MLDQKISKYTGHTTVDQEIRKITRHEREDDSRTLCVCVYHDKRRVVIYKYREVSSGFLFLVERQGKYGGLGVRKGEESCLIIQGGWRSGWLLPAKEARLAPSKIVDGE